MSDARGPRAKTKSAKAKSAKAKPAKAKPAAKAKAKPAAKAKAKPAAKAKAKPAAKAKAKPAKAKAKPAKANPAKAKPSKAKPAKAKPSKAKPAKAKPAKAKPAKAKPAKAKPAKAKPAKAKPAKAKPSKAGASSGRERLLAVAEHAIEHARRLGVDAAEVSVATGHELEVSVRQGAVELVKEAGSSGLSVRVIRDGRVATSSTTDLGRAAVEAFLTRAVEMAEVSESDPLAAPPGRRELATTWPELDLFDERTSRIDAEEAIALARTAEAAALEADKRITASEGASFGRSSGHSVLANTAGFVGERAGTYQSLAVQAVADDEGGKKRNGVYWTGGRFFSELESPTAVGREAAVRALRQLGATKMDTGVFPVVFDKDAARSILGLLAGCLLGDSVYRERSYLARKLGQSVASKHVTIVDDPLIPRGPGSRAFDGEGRPVRKLLVVERGKLQTFLLDTYSARKLGAKPTGSAAGGGGIPHASTSNFVLQAGKWRPAQLLEGIERGLYVHRMMGFGFDATTGNFSRGAEGFLIENGELTVPVGEITISRNLDELLKGIDRVADDLDHRTATTSPSFRVDAMTIAGA